MAKRNDVSFFLDYAEDARLTESKIKEKYGDKGITFIENKETDTQGFIHHVVDSNTLIISWRGSQQAQDWINDFNGWHTVIPYGNYTSKIQVHRGFLKCYKSVRGKILEYISTHRESIHQIFVAGHSLGGALSLLCALDIQYNCGIHPKVFTSGAPCVGNKEFARSYNKRVPDTTRTYARRDIVPKLPPRRFGRRLKGGYKHVAKNYAIGPKGFWAGLKAFLKRRNDFAGHLTNHSIDLYRKWC